MQLNMSVTLNRKTFNYLLIALVWCQSILIQFIRAILMRLPIIGAYPDALIMFLYVIVILLALPELRIKHKDLLVVLFILAAYILSPLLFPDTLSYWIDNASSFLLNVMPMFIIGINMCQYRNDLDKVIYLLYILSIITIISRLLFFNISGSAMTETQSMYQGDMDGAYKILPHLCLVMYYVIKKTNLINISVLTLGSFFLLFLGTRGAVLMEAICLALMILFFTNWKYKPIKIILIAGSILLYLYSPLFEMTILWLYSLASNLGMSVRIFEKFLSGAIVDSTGRDVIAEELYTALLNNPFGHGIYGDIAITGSYAHKIHLEMWIHYGVILGTIFLGIFLITPVRAFMITKSTDMKGFLVVLYCSSVLKLFLSSSYLREGLLFLVLGLSISLLRQHKQQIVGIKEYKLLIK